MGKQQYMPAWTSNITMSYNKYMAHRGAFIMNTLSPYVSILNYIIQPYVLKYHIYSSHPQCAFLNQQNVFISKRLSLCKRMKIVNFFWLHYQPFFKLCVSKVDFQEFFISTLWGSVDMKYSLSMRAPNCIQVRWLSSAVQLKWPMTYHTRRYAKTDHQLHVQQYLLYGWLKRMRTFHVSTSMRLKRDDSRGQELNKKVVKL